MNEDPKKITFLQAEHLVESNKIYQGHILSLYENYIMQGHKRLKRELIHHHPAVGILVITDENKVILVEQYRAGSNCNLLEIPAGIIDLVNNQFEDPLIAAQRELEEETSHRSNDWEYISTFYVSPGYLDEYIYLYSAKQAYFVEDALQPDDDEVITLHFYTKDDVRGLLKEGKIQDSKTIIALQHWLMEEGEE